MLGSEFYRRRHGSVVRQALVCLALVLAAGRMAGGASLVPGSLKPDSSYVNVTFFLSFDINANGFAGPIDSTSLLLELTTGQNQPAVDTIFSGTPPVAGFSNGVIAYRNLSSRADAASLVEQFYRLRMSYRLRSGNDVITITDTLPDSIYLFPREVVSYVASSITPKSAAAGAETAFDFDVDLAADHPVEIQPGSARFTITGGGFLTTVSLTIPNGQLQPGFNRLRTLPIFIDETSSGDTMRVSAIFNFRRANAPTYLAYTTSFNNQAIPVIPLGVVRIQDVVIQAPNAPYLDVGQEFQVVCDVANSANASVDSVVLQLSTDGNSILSPNAMIRNIGPNRTVRVEFSVIAAANPDPAELYRVDIIATDANQLPPLSNTVIGIVQSPPNLTLVQQAEGIDGGFVPYGSQFTITYSIVNAGQAGISDALYQLTVTGADLGVPSVSTGILRAGTPLPITFTAPQADASAAIEFIITDRPFDLNTVEPAVLVDTAATTLVQIVSAESDLLAGTIEEFDGLLQIGTLTPLFRVRLENRGVSNVSSSRLDTLRLQIEDRVGQPLNSFSLGSGTGCYVNGLLASAGTATNSAITFRLNDIMIPELSAETVTVALNMTAALANGIRLRLLTGDIYASYEQGPLAGQRVPVTTDDGPTLFDHFYASAGNDFESSFIPEFNPVHPERGPARFGYVLEQASGVTFTVYTLIGEEVCRRTLSEGTSGTSAGAHVLVWECVNDEGKEIQNGVYVATLREERGGRVARVKFAVVK